MRKRKTRGGTLAFVAVCGLILTLVGVSIFALLQVFGGVRQLQNATDSGNLNLAKMAIKRPSVAFDSTNLIDQSMVSLGDKDIGYEVNLQTYNRLVGQAFLAALNVQADDTTDSRAHLDALLTRLQTDQNSIASKLYNALSTGSAGVNSSSNGQNYNLKNEFSNLAGVNSIRMNGADATITPIDYKVGYYKSDNPCTNMLIDGMARPIDFDTGLEVPLPTNASVTGPDGKHYLRGYDNMQFAFSQGAAKTLVGVPVHPAEQPHRVSMNDFHQNRADFNIGFALPPNALYNKAKITTSGKAKDSIVESVAVVGAGNITDIPRFKDGYLIIDNTGAGDADAYTPTGASVLANELGVGIKVFGTYPQAVFSNNPGAMEAWANYDHSGPAPAEKPADAPSTTGIYNTNGDQASWQEAWNNVPKGGTPALCEDTNTGSSPCSELIDTHNGQSQGPFDLAYHRNSNLGGNNSASSSLIAVEVAKCKVWQAYYVQPFSAAISNACQNYFSDIPTTGMRLFPEAPERAIPWLGDTVNWCPPGGAGFNQAGNNPYSLNQACQVTQDGTLGQLIDQSFRSGKFKFAKGTDSLAEMPESTGADQRPTTKIKAFITNRLKQIKPNASDSEIDSVMNTTVAFNNRYFVYLDTADPQAERIVCTTAEPPQHRLNRNVKADGTPRRYVLSYDANESLVNSTNDNCIHDHHFMGSAYGKVFGHNTMAYTPSSGAEQGLLGVVRIQCNSGCYQTPPFNGVNDNPLDPTTLDGDFNLTDRD